MPPAKTTTDIVPFNQYAIVEQGDEALEIMRENLDGDAPDRFSMVNVKIPTGGGKVWDFNGEPVKTFTGVVLAREKSRAYYADKYDGQNVPPDCSASGFRVADLATGFGFPFRQEGESVEGQQPVEQACKTCPQNQWNSSRSGKGKACGERRLLLVAVPDRAMPVVLDLAPGSIKVADSFFSSLSNEAPPVSYKRAIIEFGLEQWQSAAGTASRVAMRLVGRLDESEAVKLREIADTFTGALDTAPAVLPMASDDAAVLPPPPPGVVDGTTADDDLEQV